MPDTQPLRIVFAGTPDFAAQHLSVLIDSHYDVIAVYTQPDRPAGRGKKLQASPVKKIAESNGVPVYQPVSLKDKEQQQQLRALQADVMVVVAYGLLLPEAVLDAPRHGCLNVHGSILPRWRGAAPIQRAIEAGDTETGITIMQMDAGLDTGDMLNKVFCAITPEETAATLHDKLMAIGPPALLDTLDALVKHQLRPETQDNALATYAHKLSKQEGLINWQQSTAEIVNKIRAFNPFPVAFTLLNDDRLRIFCAEPSTLQRGETQAGTIISHSDKTADNSKSLHIAAGDGVVKVTQLQLPGKKTMSVQDALNGIGAALAVGTQLVYSTEQSPA